MMRLALALPLLAALAPAQTITHIWVDAVNGNDNNPGTRQQPLQSITAGVNAGIVDSVIHVQPGVYSPSLTGEQFTIVFTPSHSNVKLLGTDAQSCVLDFEQAVGNQNDWYFLVDTGARNIEIANLTMTNGAFQPTVRWFSAAIWWRSVDGMHLHNCRIEGVESGLYSAGGAQNVSIHDNVFLGCNIPARLRQDQAMGAQNVAFFNNLVANSTGFYSDTISPSANDPTQVIVNNLIINNPGDGIAQPSLPAGVVLENNNCFNNGGTNYNVPAIPPSNLAVDPLLVNLAGGDFRLMQGSPMLDAGFPQPVANMVNDYYGNARIVDHDNDGTAVADIGVHEFSGFALRNSGFRQRRQTTFSFVQNQPNLTLGVLLSSLTPVSTAVDPFGSILIDVGTGAVFGATAIPGSISFRVPNLPALSGTPIYFQALGTGSGNVVQTSGRLDLML